jgi:hypothetical protein
MASPHPDTIPSIYKQYKANTELVAGWLVRESMGSGYVLRTKGGQAQNDAPAPRLKGKARKLVSPIDTMVIDTYTDRS